MNGASRFYEGVVKILLSECTVDLDNAVVRRADDLVQLTPAETELFRYFIDNPNRLVFREELNSVVLRYHPKTSSRAINTAIQRLRKKIERDAHRPSHLVTVYGKGFRFDYVQGEPVRDNMTSSASSFVGRTTELATMRACLERVSKLVVLGPPGSGKTRIVEEYADASRERYPGGCWLVEVTRCPDLAHIVRSLARVLRVSLFGTEDLHLLLRRIGATAGKRRQLLIVFDGAQPVIDLLKEAFANLRIPAGLNIIITSQVKRGLESWPTLDVAGLSGEDAVDLYLQRVAVAPPREHVVQLVQRLDTMPLAVEFAAARSRVSSIPRFLDDLQSEDGGFTIPAVKEALDWLWESLDDETTAFVEGCTVFQSPFDATDTATVVLGDSKQVGLASRFLQLMVDHALVKQVGLDSNKRFKLYDSVRNHARAQLDEGVVAAHAKWFTDRVLHYCTDPGEPNVSRYLALCSNHLDDLLQARQTYLREGDIDSAVRLTSAIVPFVYQAGPTSIFLELINHALRQAITPEVRADFLLFRAAHHHARRQGSACRTDLIEVIHLIGWRGRTELHGRLWGCIARSRWGPRKGYATLYYDHALQIFLETKSTVRAVNTLADLAQRMLSLATTSRNEQDYAAACSRLEEAHVLNQTIDSGMADAQIAWARSYVDRFEGRLNDARDRLSDVAERYVELCAPINVWAVHQSLAYLAWWSRGDYVAAARHLTTAQRVAIGFGSSHMALVAAAALYEAEPSELARSQLESALRESLDGQDPKGRTLARTRLALLELERGNTQDALTSLESQLAHARLESEDQIAIEELSVGLALCLQVLGRWECSREELEKMPAPGDIDCNTRRLLRRTLLAAVDCAAGRLQPAVDLWLEAEQETYELGDGRLVGIIHRLLHTADQPCRRPAMHDVSPSGAILPHERRIVILVAQVLRERLAS
jgi:DNA-binding winged helix-turn-helix (wHTH) protein/tetratricopeptide (TPR) repeat protein